MINYNDGDDDDDNNNSSNRNNNDDDDNNDKVTIMIKPISFVEFSCVEPIRKQNHIKKNIKTAHKHDPKQTPNQVL